VFVLKGQAHWVNAQNGECKTTQGCEPLPGTKINGSDPAQTAIGTAYPRQGSSLAKIRSRRVLVLAESGS
jgi:hypothetical protein